MVTLRGEYVDRPWRTTLRPHLIAAVLSAEIPAVSTVLTISTKSTTTGMPRRREKK